MYSVTDQFLQEVRNPGKLKWVADIYYDNLNLPIISDLPIVDGQLKFDRGSRSRTSGSMTIGDPTLFPSMVDDGKISPYGIEIVIRCGWVYDNGTEELIPMGRFIVNDVSGSDKDGLFPKIQFFDRAHRVWEMSTHVADSGPQSFGGGKASTALRTTVVGASPGWSTGTPYWTLTIASGLKDPDIPGGAYDGDTDRWQMATELAASMGGEVYFDRLGDAQVRKSVVLTPDILPADADWIIDTGDQGVLIDSSRTITRDGTYNSVVCTGAQAKEGEKQPIAVVYDTDSRSKTYYKGPFGIKTFRMKNNSLTSDTACLIAATEKLRQLTGLGKNVTIECLRNPALDVGDIILVIFNDGSQCLYLVDSISYGIKSAKMTIETKSVQYNTEVM